VVALVANSASTQASREALTQRGDQTLALGDVSAARLLYARAAALGSSQATMSMGRTFDPEFLSAMRARMPADPSIAAEWYRKAIALGSTEATPMLARLQEHGPR
jgi:TPR repeat protein